MKPKTQDYDFFAHAVSSITLPLGVVLKTSLSLTVSLVETSISRYYELCAGMAAKLLRASLVEELFTIPYDQNYQID